MKKIIHLSDLHIGYRERDPQARCPDMGERFRQIVDTMRLVKTPRESYVVVITGDLVESALDPANYEEARGLIATLEAEDEQGRPGFKVLVAPGNHDYGSGSHARRRYVEEFQRAFFGAVKKNRWPKLDVIDEVAFIGLDSMQGELGTIDRWGANGELTGDQIAALDRKLKTKKVRDCAIRVVYLHHHPFAPRFLHELKDSDELGAVLAAHPIDVLLFGHNHAGKKWNGMWGIPRVYDGGSSTRKESKPGAHRVIDLERDPRWDYDGDFHGSY